MKMNILGNGEGPLNNGEIVKLLLGGLTLAGIVAAPIIRGKYELAKEKEKNKSNSMQPPIK